MIGQNAVENNMFGVLDKKRNVIAGKNNLYAKAIQNCTHTQCINMVLTNNAQDAMKYAPTVVSLSGHQYKEGQIISSPNDGSGLCYLVVNENGVYNAKLLPLNYQVIYSIKELNSSRALVNGGQLLHH